MSQADILRGFCELGDVIGMHVIMEFNSQMNKHQYEGTGWIQFRSPRDRENVMQKLRESPWKINSRYIIVETSYREFDIEALNRVDLRGVSIRHPRVCVDADMNYLNNPQGGWTVAPTEWEQ
jgi:hypothetical protein